MQSAQRFGRYELRGILGQGGFATVFRAWDPGLGREVALKALRQDLADNLEVRARFLAEARALANLHNPHIVAVHDVGEANGQPFFAMELISGRTLAAAIEAGLRPGPAQLASILGDLGSAVDYLHGHGVVHRDIKPANIMLEPSGRAVLMDFGIARTLAQTQYTRTGVALGTPEYMSPEQVRGSAVGPPSDMYALGVLTYHLLAGRPPFTGDTGFVLHAQAYEPPPSLQAVRPELPAAVCAAVAAALAKDPAARPRSVMDFASAIAGAPLPRTPTRQLPHRPLSGGRRGAIFMGMGIAVVLLLALIGGVAAAVHRGSSGTPAPAAAAATKPAVAGSTSPTPAAAQQPGSVTPPPPPTPQVVFVTVTAAPPTPKVVLVTATPPPETPQVVFVTVTAVPATPQIVFVTVTAPPPPTRTATVAAPTSVPPPPPPPQPTAAPVPSVAGNWAFIDYIRYGPQTGNRYPFNLRLMQQGTLVTGVSDAFTLSGTLQGRVLHATYGEGNTAGEFTWSFASDGTRFEGVYTNTVGNGGNSYGRRTGGSISNEDQATVFAVGPGFTGTQASSGSDLYICYTVSHPSHITLRSVVSGQVLHDSDDDGTGDCAGPYPASTVNADPNGRLTYQATMSSGGRALAESFTTLTVVR